MSFKPLLSVIMAGALLVTVACDPSKPELDKTKAELTTVSADRDSLKGQLEQANSKVAALTQQVADLNAKAAAAAAAPPPAAEEPDKKKTAAKPKAGGAKPLTKEQKKEIEAAPTKRSGRGHF
jgi:ABC-type oligopeptide transport system substrate-binding subunit